MAKNTPFGSDDAESSFDPSTTAPGEGDVTSPVSTEPVAEPTVEYVEPENGVRVAALPGNAFLDPDSGLPLVTSDGLTVTQEQADSLIEKGEGIVVLVETKED